ncbi:hypothetical protein ABEP17_08675 [Priestia flexa]|uniref:hypothetical protein n=1 Tax=Priestia flexa TaxID=86664 RepID=UPI003D2E40BA
MTKGTEKLTQMRNTLRTSAVANVTKQAYQSVKTAPASWTQSLHKTYTSILDSTMPRLMPERALAGPALAQQTVRETLQNVKQQAMQMIKPIYNPKVKRYQDPETGRFVANPNVERVEKPVGVEKKGKEVESVRKVETGQAVSKGTGEKDISKLTTEDIPTAKSGKFNDFFNSLSTNELNELWQDKKIRKKIERQLREPGGLHEWHLVSRAPQFKFWDISAEKIKDLRTAISDVKFVNPKGVHGGLGSTKAHNELLAIIDTSNDYNTFIRKLNNWAYYRLEGGISSLPEGLRLK